jgi:5'(3')-deoxyribonucleotidase
MIFLFDVDGVCADLVGKVLSELESEFGVGNIPPYDQIINYDFLDSNKTPLSKKQVTFAHKLMDHEGFTNSLELIADCKETIDALRKHNHTVKWVTTPHYGSKTWCFDRLLWLKANFNADEADLIYAKDKSLIFGDVFVDDTIPNIEAWQASWKNSKGLLYQQPWNSESSITRVKWKDIAKIG